MTARVRAMGAIVETFHCCHCGEQAAGPRTGGALHRSGPQMRLQSCAVDPYGFIAHAEGTECPAAWCLGSSGREVQQIHRD